MSSVAFFCTITISWLIYQYLYIVLDLKFDHDDDEDDDHDDGYHYYRHHDMIITTLLITIFMSPVEVRQIVIKWRSFFFTSIPVICLP